MLWIGRSALSFTGLCVHRFEDGEYKLSSFRLKFLPAIIVSLIIESCKRHGYMNEFPNLGERLEEETTRLRSQYVAQRTAKVTEYITTGNNPSGLVGNKYMPTGMHTNVPGANGGFGAAGVRANSFIKPHA